MNSMPGRAKRLESAVSICLLAVLFLIGLGMFIRQSRVDMSRFGMEAAVAPKSEIPFDLGSLTPAGFETRSRTETYDSGNLYEKINGKAGLYLDSGFKKLITQRFVHKDDKDLIMELYLYDMGNVRGAFSVYGVQRRADVNALPAFPVSYAYGTSNALYLVHGKYYIELVGFSESAELLGAMMQTVQKIRANLAADSDIEIAELSLFPTEDIVQGSVKLYLTDGLAFEGLTDTFTARYKVGDQTITAFLSKCASAEEAHNVAESYCKFLIDNGGATVKPATDKISAGKIIVFHYETFDTFEIVLSIGAFVVGVHEAESQELAEKLALKLVNKLSRAENQ